MSTLEVLSILDAPVVTGPARGLIHLGRYLPAGVHLNVALFHAPDRPPLPRLDEMARGRMTLLELPEKGAFDPFILKRALELARRVGVGLVQSHAYKSHVIAAFLRKAMGIPWLGHHHGWTAENAKVKLYHQVDSLTLPRAEKVVAVADSARKIAQSAGVAPERLVLIPNAVDLEDLQTEHTRESARAHFKLEEGVTYGCAIGRLSHEKGQDVLVRAVGRLQAQGVKDFGVLLAGDGPERANLEALVDSLGVKDRVRFLGHQKQVAAVYRASDFMVLPSRSEAMPNVLLEAMALGVPSVATRVGGVPEVADDGTTAWIVPSEDPPALAEAMAQCLRDATERAQRAQRARAVVAAQHDPRRRAQRYVEVYESLLGRSLGPPKDDAREPSKGAKE
ncbi:MAG: glycosyltransferase [Deltaproteobacteria bacterium]|nr:glycosyltransferase [Deltaproteobacteria bacterium]